MHQRQCLSVISIVGLSTPLAALLTRMSRRSKCLPNSANISSTTFGNADAALDRHARAGPAREFHAQRLGLVGLL